MMGHRYTTAFALFALTLAACGEAARPPVWPAGMAAQQRPSRAVSARAAYPGGPLQAGEQAPDFTLISSAGKPIHLATELQARGTVVLIFYPSRYCRLCLEGLAAFDAQRDLFEARGARLIALGAQTADEAAASAQDSGAQFAILADGHAQVARNYGIPRLLPGKTKYPQAILTVFVVGTSGAIQWSGPAMIGGQAAIQTILDQLPS